MPDTYWKRCETCGGTGYVHKQNKNGTYTQACKGCNGRGGKPTPVGQ